MSPDDLPQNIKISCLTAFGKTVREICEAEQIQPWEQESYVDIISTSFSAGIHYACDFLGLGVQERINTPIKEAADKTIEKTLATNDIQPWDQERVKRIINIAFSQGVSYVHTYLKSLKKDTKKGLDSVSKIEKTYDDTCAWCKHPLKVYILSWQKCKSHIAMPILANYCDAKTCREEGCKHDCMDIALSTPENTESMLHEVVRRIRKLERLESEKETEEVPSAKEEE